MKIRHMRRGEVREAAAIVGKNYSREYELLARKELRDMFSRDGPHPVYCVAVENNEIVGLAGYIQSWMDYNIYQIFWVNVTPARMREGIGRRLMRHLIREIVKKKDAYLILLTADAGKNLPRYYSEFFGFKTLKVFGPEYHLMALPVKQ